MHNVVKILVSSFPKLFFWHKYIRVVLLESKSKSVRQRNAWNCTSVHDVNDNCNEVQKANATIFHCEATLLLRLQHSNKKSRDLPASLSDCICSGTCGRGLHRSANVHTHKRRKCLSFFAEVRFCQFGPIGILSGWSHRLSFYRNALDKTPTCLTAYSNIVESATLYIYF